MTLFLHNVATERGRVPGVELAAGQTARILCGSHDERTALWEVLSGARTPVQGTVRMLDRDLYALTAAERVALVGRIGWVAQDGGLVSNLKVWENIILPAGYHRGKSPAELERDVLRSFEALGVTGAALPALMRRLPDRLSPLERRWVALVRAQLMQPDIIVYDAPFSGVARDDAETLRRWAAAFHGENTQRVSLFLLPAEPYSDRVASDVTVTL